MTDLATIAAPRRPLRPAVAPMVFLAVGGAAAAGLVLGRWSGASTLRWDPHLVVLLRFMAAVKLAGVLGASALSLWRARTPLSAGTAFAMVAALASMALAPGLIWSLAHVGLAAALFHGGLLAFLVMAWRDDPRQVPADRAGLRAIHHQTRSAAVYDHGGWNAGSASPLHSRN